MHYENDLSLLIDSLNMITGIANIRVTMKPCGPLVFNQTTYINFSLTLYSKLLLLSCFCDFSILFLNEDGQFNENCSMTTPCDSSKHLECRTNRCLCMSSHYHWNETCYNSMYICQQSLSNHKISYIF